MSELYPFEAESISFYAGWGMVIPGYVGVVPGVVIHYDCSVRHCRDLITIIPPGHHLENFCMISMKFHVLLLLLHPLECFVGATSRLP